MFRAFLGMTALALLAGCASTSQYTESKRYAPVRFVQDRSYMNTVERAADQNGVEVVWVNPPQRAVERRLKPQPSS